MTLVPNLTFDELLEISKEHLQRMWHASREWLPFNTSYRPLFRTLHMLLLQWLIFENLRVFPQFSRFCTLTKKVVGTIWWDLTKPPQVRQNADTRPICLLWLLRALDLSRRTDCAKHSQLWRMLQYIFDTMCFKPKMSVCCILMASPQWSAVGPRFVYGEYVQVLNVCRFDPTAFAVSGKVCISLTGLFTPFGWQLLLKLATDLNKSVCNRCLIEYFGGVFLLSLDFISVGMGILS